MNEKPRRRTAPGSSVRSPAPHRRSKRTLRQYLQIRNQKAEILMSFCAHKGRHRRRETPVPTFPRHPQEMLLSLEHIPKFKAITKHEEQPCCASFENTKLERVACSATAAKQTKKYGEPACSPYFPQGSVSLRSGSGGPESQGRKRKAT